MAGNEEAGNEEAGRGYPLLRQVVLDGTDVRELAEFYRQLLGWQYRPGDEPPAPGEPDPAGQDWLVLRDAAGAARLAFQQVAELPQVTWPDGAVPQQMHLDLYVTTADELGAAHQRALGLGARMISRPVGRPGGAAARLRRPGRASVLHLPRPAAGLTLCYPWGTTPWNPRHSPARRGHASGAPPLASESAHTW